MNRLELEMVNKLKELKEFYGVIRVKAEFEAEGSRINELMRLRDIASRSGVGLTIKIGGAEAKCDIYHSLHIGADCLIAPMIETPYAAKKYISAVNEIITNDELENIEIGFNIETITGLENLEDILNKNDLKNLRIITVGRTDLTGSMGLSMDNRNSLEVYEKCEKIMKIAKKKNIKCGLGGGISPESVDFMKKLIDKGLLDFYETRKVIFQNVHADKETISKGISKAVQLEYIWLQNKRNYYLKIYEEDDPRIKMLEERIELAKKTRYL